MTADAPTLGRSRRRICWGVSHKHAGDASGDPDSTPVWLLAPSQRSLSGAPWPTAPAPTSGDLAGEVICARRPFNYWQVQSVHTDE